MPAMANATFILTTSTQAASHTAFQQKRDADPGEDEYPDPKDVDPIRSYTRQQEHAGRDQQYGATNSAMKRAIPTPVGSAADCHRKKDRRCGRRMERMPKDSEEAEQSPRNQRSYKPIADRGWRTTAGAFVLCHNLPPTSISFREQTNWWCSIQFYARRPDPRDFGWMKG
jgi:hypothetical protein